MNWLLESTLERNLALLALAAGAVVLAVTWMRSGKRLWLIASVVVGAVVALTVLAGQLFVTPREEVEQTLRTIAADVQNNDLQAVLSHIHSSRDDIRLRAQAEMPRYRFEEVRINSIKEITADGSGDPPTAEAQFYVGVHGDFGGGEVGEVYGDRGLTRFVILKFEKEGDAWKVIDYEHRAPFGNSGVDGPPQ
ncbi:MAG: hypothetical protein RIC55_28155 [Pirellulaceae bacterium]